MDLADDPRTLVMPSGQELLPSNVDIPFPDSVNTLPDTSLPQARERSAMFSGRALEGAQPSWFAAAEVICCINCYPNGITFSVHGARKLAEETGSSASDGADNVQQLYGAQEFHLRFRDTRDYRLPEGKYFLYRDDFAQSLERQLSSFHKRDILKSAVVYLGVTADPFLAFSRKFYVTTSCLEILEQYRPGLLVVQTRSPMVIAALPALKNMEREAVVVIPVESHLEKSIARYTPGQPRIAERLVAAQGLRRQGIKVNLCVSPVLPYGEYYRDAWAFAEILDQHADYITFGCLATGQECDEKELRILPAARKLAADKQFRWLRPQAYRYLHHAVSVVRPAKLKLPPGAGMKPTQLALFAA